MNIILVGNPNVGKSVVFGALTGTYVTVSNYPGTTVDISKGSMQHGGAHYTVYDTPGVLSLSPFSEDEKVTKEIITNSDVGCIIQVADAKNIIRSLMLTSELIELGVPLILDLNMTDEARSRGIRIDTKKLSDLLGIDVIETVAVTGEGIGRVKDALLSAKIPKREALHIDRQDKGSSEKRTHLLKKRDAAVRRLAARVVVNDGAVAVDASERVAFFVTRPATGIPVLIGVIVFMYIFVGRFAAGTLVDFFQKTLFEAWLMPLCARFIDRAIPILFVRDLIIGPYGLLSMAITYAFAIVLPIVGAFFFLVF